MAEKEFSTSFFSNRCGEYRGCKTSNKRMVPQVPDGKKKGEFLILPFCGPWPTEVYVFSDSVLCLGEIHENSKSNTAWEDRLAWFKSSQEYRDLHRIDGEPMKLEWTIFPGFNTLQLSQEFQELLLRFMNTTEFHKQIDVQRHHMWIKRHWNENASQMLDSFL